MRAEDLTMALMATETALARLGTLVAESAEALAAMEQRAVRAEQALIAARRQLAGLKGAPDVLGQASAALLVKLEEITTEQFQCGAERAERAALRAVLETIQGDQSL